LKAKFVRLALGSITMQKHKINALLSNGVFTRSSKRPTNF